MSFIPSQVKMTVSTEDTPVSMTVEPKIIIAETPNDPLFNNLLKHALTELTDGMLDNGITELYDYAFYGNEHLATVNLTQIRTIGTDAFAGCGLTTAYLPNLTTAGMRAFSGTTLTSIVLPKLTTVSTYMFQNCTDLESVELDAAASIQQRAFDGCTKLERLTLKSETVCVLGTGSQFFRGTKIESGEGYIYVPSDLYSAYKADSTWTNYRDSIREIEEMTF